MTTRQGNNGDKGSEYIYKNIEKDSETEKAFESKVSVTSKNAKIGNELAENIEGSFSRKRPVGLRHAI